ncbi:MAG: transcriptional regulator GcvA [Alphaproteobacteria bacterium]|nr:transcriptional regulator GcvA [Alphaproteobacteria bacterium]
MRFRLPALNALRAFEAAARHCSFTEAAHELCVGQGAVSRHIVGLERSLGVALFHRHHRGVTLTREGQSYFETLHRALTLIHDGTAQLLGARDAEIVRLIAPPTFTSRWLLPRLGGFSARHPGAEVRISTSQEFIDFDRDDFDLAISYGDGSWPRLEVAPLIDECLVMVCRPQLADGRPPPASLDELRRYVLLHSLKRPGEWRHWLDFIGKPDVPDVGGLRFGASVLAYQAAIDGLGLAIAQSDFVSDELAAGRLLMPFPVELRTGRGYFVTRAAGHRLPPVVAAFRDWLIAQAGRASGAGAAPAIRAAPPRGSKRVAAKRRPKVARKYKR